MSLHDYSSHSARVPQGVSDKSKVVAGVLQIVLGGFGVGRFYMGDTKTGVIQLIVTLVTAASAASGAWSTAS